MTYSNTPSGQGRQSLDNVATQFKPNLFWDNILQPKKYLGQAFAELKRGYQAALITIAPDVPAIEPNRKKLKSIEERMRLEPEFISMAYDANATLVKFTNLRYKKKEQNVNFLTDAELEEAGLTEEVYKKTLLQVSRFIARIYDMSVPEQVIEYCRGIALAGPAIPAEELERISLKHLRDNIGMDLFPCVIVVDNAIYMSQSDQMENLTDGLNRLFEEIMRDKHLRQRMQLFIVTTGKGPVDVFPFDNVANQIGYLESCTFKPFGPNMMADSLERALEALEKRRAEIVESGSRYFTPWMIVLSNGQWLESKNAGLPGVASRLREMDARGKIHLYVRSLSPVGKKQMDNLRVLSDNVAQLTDVSGFFRDVYDSLRSSTNSSAGGEKVPLVNRFGFQ
ncbi:MAG: hypothetical protein K2L26_06180 [Duncaniella sp.]|nr:hypothetical protein [Duncaniella sp.]MDE6390985.1 hypothetical protein [Duncaniella sp.]